MNPAARNLVRHIVALEGWAAMPPRRVRAMAITAIGNGPEAGTALTFLDRLRQSPELLLRPENFDLLPPAIRAKMRRKMRELLDGLGVRYRIDDAGELWPDGDQLADALGIDRSEVHEMARKHPSPVGELHTLQ